MARAARTATAPHASAVCGCNVSCAAARYQIQKHVLWCAAVRPLAACVPNVCASLGRQALLYDGRFGFSGA